MHVTVSLYCSLMHVVNCGPILVNLYVKFVDITSVGFYDGVM